MNAKKDPGENQDFVACLEANNVKNINDMGR